MNFKRGDIDAGFAEADVVVEHTWRSAVVHQSYIEPHSTVADYDASGELSVWTSTQAPFYISEELSQTLGIPENKIRVTATEVGGGFGGKIYLQELMVAALAMMVRRPVKYIMSRKEDMLAATPAPQAVVELKTGMKRDGTLTALQVARDLRLRRLPRRADAPRLPARRRLLQVRKPRHPGLRGADEQGQRRRPSRPRRSQRHLRHREPHGHHGPRARPRPDRGAPQERRRGRRPAPQRPAVPPHRPQGVHRGDRRERGLEAQAEDGNGQRRTAASASPSAAGSAASSRRARSSV